MKQFKTIALKRATFPIVLLALAAGSAMGEPASVEQRLELSASSEPVVSMGDVVITHAELDAHIQNLPPDSRAQAVSSMERIDKMLQGLLLNKALYEAAKESELLDDPATTFRAIYAAAEELTREQMKRHVESRKLDDYEQQARELFLSSPEKFESVRSYDFTHVLVSVADRSEAEAMQRILEVHEQVQGGANLETLVQEYSEDGASIDEGGAYRNATLDRLDRNFSRALSQLESPGDTSGPVRSRFGWHIIRLDERHEPVKPDWEDAREQAVEMARDQHESRIREAYIDKLLDPDTVEVVPGSIERFQKRHGYNPEASRQDPSGTE